MFRKLVVGLGLVMLGSTLLYARPGSVVTKDGHTYEGDITEDTDSVTVTGVPGLPGPVKINKANVGALTYADKIAEEVRAGLAKLGPKDVKSRIDLARFAIEKHAYAAAHEVLVDAAKIEPGNRDVSDLMIQLAPHLPPPPATVPATMPATAPAVPVKAPVVSSTPKRQVTPAEINLIRQLEWRRDGDPTVKIQIKPETKTKFIDTYADVTKAEFSKMTASQQAAMILDKGNSTLSAGVQLTTDPASIIEFKKINQVVVHTCGGACHNGSKPGQSFTLSTTQNNAGIYTNFLILQQHTVRGLGPLIDRANPESSVLLLYMLDPTLTPTPHPQLKEFKAPARSKNEDRYKEVLHWIESLAPIAPHYNIDLTQPLPPAPPPAK
jgi:hypothetical protein